MTQEDKELLLKDLCARLPYGVIVKVSKEDNGSIKSYDKSFDAKTYQLLLLNGGYLERGIMYHYPQFSLKPYLRPMSSMTMEEVKELAYKILLQPDLSVVKNYKTLDISFTDLDKVMNWLNEHHFDYRDLIPMGLALEAPEDMYKN